MDNFKEGDSLEYHPIGRLSSPLLQRQESPRQGSLSDVTAELHLYGGANFEPALEGLIEFERVWLIFHFDRNDTWNPKVRPPAGTKIGVFASRSPYRPNGIGMSCVRLEKIEGRVLTFSGIDLLDGTPVLDIKPYLPYADAFPDSRTGWTASDNQTWDIAWTETAQHQLDFLCDQGMQSLEPFANSQLRDNPTDEKRKRIHVLSESRYAICYRTWILEYRLTDSTVTIEQIYSGYTPQTLLDGMDPYEDKELHQLYNQAFTPINARFVPEKYS